MRELESHYRFLRPLAAGGEGEVFLAEDLRRAGLQVAVKVMPAARGAPAEFRQLARVRHRSLARVLDAGRLKDPPRSYLTTEYFPGRPLTALPAPLSWPHLGSILREACAALATLNEAGLRHGDLKPAHVLYEEQDQGLRVRIIDLGHARPLVDPSPARTGTAPYAAPELWTGEPAGPTTDLYALGMCCIELLAGGLPVRSGKLADWRQWHLSADRRALFDELAVRPPAQLRELLRECIQPDPADRPRDAAALRARLQGGIAILDIDAPPPPLVGRDALLAELAEWLQGAGRTDDRDVLLMAGPRGIGKTRFLEALARRARVEDLPVWELQEVPDAPPRDGLCIADEVPLSALSGWARTLGRRPRGQRSILALADTDALDTEAALAPWSQHGPTPRLLFPGPIDRDAARTLLEEARDVRVSVATAETRWRHSAGMPGALLARSVAPQSPHVLRSRHARQCQELARLLPAPLPAEVLASVFECSAPRLARTLASAQGQGPLAAGWWPDLMLHPRAAGDAQPADEATSHAAIVARVADAWEQHGDADAGWGPTCLRLRAGLPASEEQFRTQCETLARGARWQELARLAAAGRDRYSLLSVPFLVRAWSGDGRIEDALAQLPQWSARPQELPADAALEVARLAALGGSPERAAAFFQRALDDPPDSAARIDITTEAILNALAMGRRDDAMALRATLAPGDIEVGNAQHSPSLMARARVGTMLVQLGERDTARQVFQQTLAAARGRGHGELEAQLACLSGLAGLDRIEGAGSDDALARLELGLRYARMSRRAHQYPQTVQLLRFNMAAILAERGDTEAALAHYRRLEREVRDTGNLRLLPHVLVAMGSLFRYRGELTQAVRGHLRAERAAAAVGNIRARINTLRNLGSLYLSLGDTPSAYRARLAALRLSARTGDRGIVAFSRALLGTTLVHRGEHDIGVRMLELAHSETSGNPMIGARIENSLALAAWCRGERDTALRHWGAACRNALRSDSHGYACEAIRGMARVVAVRGARQRARALLARARRVARRDATPMFTSLPVELDQLNLDREEHGLDETVAGRAAELFEAARAHGLWEAALLALTLLCRCTPDGCLVPERPLPAEAITLVRSVLKRLGEKERTALAARLGLEQLAANPLGERQEAVQLPAAVETSLADWCRDHSRTSAQLRVRVTDADWVELASHGSVDPGRARVERLNLGADGPQLVLASVGSDAARGTPHGALAQLAERIWPAVLTAVQRFLEQRSAGLSSELDRLRERSLADRERMETELLSQRLEVRHRGEVSSTRDLAEGPDWVARSEPLRELMKGVERWAPTEISVFIQGESGTGKDRLARLIHDRSERAAAPFHIENFSAVPESLIEAELFGYQRGAFTGAERDRGGSLDRVAGGTLVLDHVDELPERIQVRLLRVLQDGVYRPLGASEERRMDVRLIATSLRPPRELVDEGRLREDFYYRLQGVEVHLPPLRDRREDIGALLEAMFQWHARRLGIAVPRIDAAALTHLEEEAWPGNVRELGNRVLRWMLMGLRRVSVADLDPVRGGDESPPADPAATGLPPAGAPWREANAAFQRRHLTASLELHGWNRSRTAEALGISRRQLHNLLDKLEIRSAANGRE